VNAETHDEDGTILAALEALEALEGTPADVEGVPGLPDAPAAAAGEAGLTLSRLYVEVLGLIPYELAPYAPSAALGERLLAIVAGDETQDVGASVVLPPPPPGLPPPSIPSTPRAAPTPVPGTLRAPQATAALRLSAPAVPPPFPPARLPIRPRPVRRWPLALAAMLVLALGALSAWLWTGLQQQSEKITSLEEQLRQLNQLSQARSRAASAPIAPAGDPAGIRGQPDDLRAKLDLVTSPMVAVCALRPPARSPAAAARGMLFVAADHQHWYLRVQGLEPPAAGRQYQLWFLSPAGPVSAGTFAAAPGAPVALSSEHMPAGTVGVVITLEPAPGSAAPSGPEILRAGRPTVL